MNILSSPGFMPHGHCYLWNPTLVATMLAADLLIGLAYLSISLGLYALVRKIRLPFSGMFLAFGLFIAACGATHFMEIYTLWIPSYWLAALIKVITAAASVSTAVWLFPLIPRVVALAHAARSSEEHRLRLEEKTSELQKQSRDLTAINQELESFSYSVSHDLRAPLRAIMGFSCALLEDAGPRLNGQDKEQLEKVIAAASRMGSLIDGLLDLSKLTRREILAEKVNLSKIAHEVLELLKKEQPEREVDARIEGGLIVKGDSELLRAALTNMIQNAWKFTSKRPVTRIDLWKESQGGGAAEVYSISDNGAGFDMKYADKLFGAFQRLHSPMEFSGNGIGLATVQRIIRRHGGRIWAEAEPGKGATFHFTLHERAG